MSKVSRIGRPRGSNLLAAEASPRAIARDVGPVLYAVRQPGGLIKIGHSAHIYDRLQALGGLSNLLALRAGTYEDEQEIHHSLNASCHHGREYYNATPEVLAVVNDMRAAMRQGPIAA